LWTNIKTQVLWSQIPLWWFEIPKHWCIVCLCFEGFFVFMQLFMVHGLYVSVSMFWTQIPTFSSRQVHGIVEGKTWLDHPIKLLAYYIFCNFLHCQLLEKVMRVNTTCSPSLSSFKAILNKLSINFQCLFWVTQSSCPYRHTFMCLTYFNPPHIVTSILILPLCYIMNRLGNFCNKWKMV